jgi:hypothetical protein
VARRRSGRTHRALTLYRRQDQHRGRLYRGGAPAINDLVAGQVDFRCVSLNTVVSQIQGDTIKAIAIVPAPNAPT